MFVSGALSAVDSIVTGPTTMEIAIRPIVERNDWGVE
jgi:hypothetical protein